MKITYLLGAGASYDALPIVKDINDKLLEFAELFKPSGLNHITSKSFFDIKSSNPSNYYLAQYDYNSKDFLRVYNLIKKVKDEISWLYEVSKNQSSIDTLAKKLFLQKDFTALKRLKVVMSCFFYYCQTKKFDKRYDSFFASILEDLNSLPENIRIVSWNYDSQLEIAFKEFSKGSIKSSKNSLNIYSKVDVENGNYNPNTFSVFKLNGTTGEISDEFFNDFQSNQNEIIGEVLNAYDPDIYRSFNPKMSFAWENFNLNNEFYNNLKSSSEETETLIVVGYSFPFFNRKIDEFVLGSMYNLKKVYVQDPNYSDEIIEKIKGLRPWQLVQIMPGLSVKEKTIKKDVIEFIPKTFTDQFFIPIEF